MCSSELARLMPLRYVYAWIDKASRRRRRRVRVESVDMGKKPFQRPLKRLSHPQDRAPRSRCWVMTIEKHTKVFQKCIVDSQNRRMIVDVMEGIQCLGGCGTLHTNGLTDAKQNLGGYRWRRAFFFALGVKEYCGRGNAYVAERTTIAMSVREEPSGNCVRGVQRLWDTTNWKRQWRREPNPFTYVTSACFMRLEINYIMYGVYKKKQWRHLSMNWIERKLRIV
jgi:hypothetical protein